MNTQLRWPGIAVLGICAILGGCSLQPVQPWEKNLLAKDEMQLSPDRIEDYLDGHAYANREASSGGKGVGGGAADAINTPPWRPRRARQHLRRAVGGYLQSADRLAGRGS